MNDATGRIELPLISAARARAFALLYDPSVWIGERGGMGGLRHELVLVEPALARWPDRMVGPWRRLARGCRCNRATAELMVTCGGSEGPVLRASGRSTDA